MTRLLQFLVDRATSGFYGDITIRFKAGKVVKVSVQQDYLLDTLPPSRGAQTVAVTGDMATM